MTEVQPLVAGSVDTIFCSVNQAAEALCLAPYTVRELCRAGAIEGAKYGGRWLVSVSDLNRYAAELLARRESA